ncbi:hypothetical protein Daus18300_001372 [Diaporthe australafricana]|uniref:Uncharacterized protein n=1 Tax=Diaporthe australafricana TaxID=127596 RepID=A0ABR3XXM3_9PEZI
MADWDPSTIASVAALVVATFALVIALAQALQQFSMTGQLIRICDSVVFGPMPGQGRRVWQLSQFRFRVLYSIPQISLSAELWPSGSANHVKSYAIGRHPLPWLANDDMAKATARFARVGWWRVWKGKMRALPMRPANWWRKPSVYVADGPGDLRVDRHYDEASVSTRRWRFPIAWSNPFQHRVFSASWWSAFIRNKEPHTDHTSSYYINPDTTSPHAKSYTKASVDQRVGEASWVSFCRAIEIPCGSSVRLDHVQYDADRCPSDLVSAPMQVSMRDIIVMGLMAGMDITSASFHEKSISMQGAVGTITSSKHAVLGPILHFTPRNVNENELMAYGFGYYFGRFGRGFVDIYWLARTWDVCCIAGRFFNAHVRRTTRRLDDRWIRDQDNPNGKSNDGEGHYDSRDYASRRHKTQAWRDIVRMDTKPDSKEKAGTEGEKPSGPGKEVIKTGRAIPEARPQDGQWTIHNPLMPPTAKVVDPNIDQQRDGNERRGQAEAPTVAKGSEMLHETQNVPGIPHIPTQERRKSEDNLDPPRTRRRTTVEDVSDHESESPSRVQPVLEPEGSGVKPKVQKLPPGMHTAAEEASRNSSEKSTPVLEDDGQRAAFKSEDISIQARQNEVAGEVLHEHTDIRNDKEIPERVQTAKRLQAIRAERLRQIQRDKEVVEDSVKRGVLRSPLDEAAGRGSQLLLTSYAHNEEAASSSSSSLGDASTEEHEAGEDYGEEEPTKEEREAHEREVKRKRERIEREVARDERNKARNRAVGLGHVDIYWMSQMDVMRGYWATRWHRSHTPLYTALTGCVTVVLEAQLGFVEPGHIIYKSRSRTTTAWMCEWNWDASGDGTGSYNHSYPAYAHNAKKGVIAAGVYTGCRLPSFPSRVMPVLELARSYKWQVNQEPRSKTEVEEQNVELVRIDSWLSYVGRLDEISEGPHRLLSQTPALIKLLMEEFEVDFHNIDLSADQGGLQDIQGLAANVMDFLTDEELTEAEQLYVLVALLRSAKVAQSVLAGSDTDDLLDILTKDVLAHLV